MAIASMGSAGTQRSGAAIAGAPFGRTPSGVAIEIYTLRNHRGMEAQIATYGGLVTSLKTPDSDGHYADVVLGSNELAAYLSDTSYVGGLIGRYGNRIGRGKFSLNGLTYTLAANDGPNALHGGTAGFDKVVWRVTNAQITPRGPQLTLEYQSRDGEEGYPGNLTASVAFTLAEDNSLLLELNAVTDADTVVNLTQHSYFNLRGWGDVHGHLVRINADRFLPVDRDLIPTGESRAVAGSAFDFRQLTAIGANIGNPDEQLRFAKGYDHNWVLNKRAGELRLDATVYEPDSGRVLEVLSTQPGLQFYSGNSLDGSFMGRHGRAYGFRNGFCLEPQHFPDSPNQPEFPSTVLKRGHAYDETIIYRFRTI